MWAQKPMSERATNPGRKRPRLALRELEGATRLRAAVLLALHRARVAGEKAAGLQHRAQAGLVIDQGAGDAVAHRAGLARQTPAIDGDDHVKLAVAIGGDQWLAQDHAQHGTGEI